MSYLITSDYQRVIQTNELNAITTNSVSIRQLVENGQQTYIRANLIQEFDIDSEFIDMNAFDPTVIYKGNQRVYLDAAAYNPASTYALSALTLQGGKVYICTTPIMVDEPFNSAHWTLLGNQYDMFYVSLPQPLFDSMQFYNKGDQVWWKDSVYTAIQDSLVTSQQDVLQSSQRQDVKFGNGVPGTYSGKNMWGTGTPYSVSAGTLPTNTTYWTKGDNRNQMIVNTMLNMVVYELSKRIAPGNVPEVRHNAWVKANDDLKRIASGNINSLLNRLEPLKGDRIRSGGTPQEINVW